MQVSELKSKQLEYVNSEKSVRQVTKNAVACYDDNDIAEAARVMSQHHFRRPAIVKRENKLMACTVLETAEAIH